MLSATSSPHHLIVFSTLPCLLSSSSSLPPLLPSSHLSQHSPPISALASLVSSSPPHVTYYAALFGSLSSAILPTCLAHCSLAAPHQSLCQCSSSSALLSVLVTLAIFRTKLVGFVVVVRSLPRFPFRIAMPMSNHTSARDLAFQSF